jgi:hypothetical protein
MRMSQLPRCCGAVIISDLGIENGRYIPGNDLNWGRYVPTTNKEQFEKDLKKRLNKARFNDHRGVAFAIWTNENCAFIPGILEAYGFTVVDKTRNPRTGKILNTYICHLSEIKKPL